MKTIATRPGYQPTTDIWDDTWPTPFEHWFGQPFALSNFFGRHEDYWAPTNVHEEDDEYKIDVEVPGFPPENIEVEVLTNGIQITGEFEEEECSVGSCDEDTDCETENCTAKEEKKKEKNKNGACCREERSYQSFSRFVSLPADADLKKAKAEIKNGILAIKVPKSKEKEKKRNVLKIKH